MNFTTEEVPKEPTRFYWIEDDPKSAWIDVVALTLEEIQGFQKECTKTVRGFAIDPKDGISKLYRDSDFDKEKFSDLCTDAAIVAWDGWKINGKPTECTTENKIFMVSNFDEFEQFFNKCTKKVNAELLKSFGGGSEAKNSKSTRRKR